MITKNTLLKDILKLAPPCSCNACQQGCKTGSGLLVKEDIKEISKFLKITEEKLKQEYLEELELFNKKMFRPKVLRNGKPYGNCIFFDRKIGCKIHEVRPLQCKIAMCCKDYGEQLINWFVLNYIIDPSDPESIRQFAQYLKAGGKTIEKGELRDIVPDRTRLAKILSYELLK